MKLHLLKVAQVVMWVGVLSLGQTRAADRSANASSPKPTRAELKAKLDPDQFHVTQESGTEAPFKNKYWDFHEDGIYVDLVSGEPLFSSLDKYDSGTGWPSFTQPIEAKNVAFKSDQGLSSTRTEVRSKDGDAHLGHVFDDGPGPDGKRFCMNSAALKFISLDQLKTQGYGKFLFSFAKKKNWEIATLAGGCFWGMEELLRTQPGVIETQVGYTGGTTQNPKYPAVHAGQTGHAESVQILFDPKKTSYENLLLLYFRLHDPTTRDRQGGDVGSSYRSAIFYESPEQKRIAEKVKARVEKSGQWKKPIVTEIAPAAKFWRAEDDHQKYLEKNPHGYTCHFLRKLEF